MTTDATASLPYDAPLGEYEREAGALLAALRAGDRAAAWRVKWEHPRFKDEGVERVSPAAITIDDARMVVAREYGFDDWSPLASFACDLIGDEGVRSFEGSPGAVYSL